MAAEQPSPISAAMRTPTKKEQLWAQMEDLKTLFEQGLLTKEEFEERKNQVIDQLTGTKGGSKPRKTPKKAPAILPDEDPNPDSCEVEVPRNLLKEDSEFKEPPPPPAFSLIQREAAVKHIFDPHKRSWSHYHCYVKLDSKPFAKGTLREAYYLQMMDNQKNQTPTKKKGKSTFYVAKMSIDPFEDRNTYFKDVETQMYAKEWAMRFNLYNPPKRVDFIACSVLELIERPGKPICGVERFIEGPYRKHNNNIGFVSEAERNTPQAFSHFTYYASNRSIVICDIQGVGDLYTDPQIHTIANLKGIETVFGGKGNMGVLGLERFLESHRCNPICAYLRLPPVQGSESSSVSRGGGTLPHTPYMEFQKVEVLRVQIKDATEVPTIIDEEKLPLIEGQDKESRYSCICSCSLM